MVNVQALTARVRRTVIEGLQSLSHDSSAPAPIRRKAARTLAGVLATARAQSGHNPTFPEAPLSPAQRKAFHLHPAGTFHPAEYTDPDDEEAPEDEDDPL